MKLKMGLRDLKRLMLEKRQVQNREGLAHVPEFRFSEIYTGLSHSNKSLWHIIFQLMLTKMLTKMPEPPPFLHITKVLDCSGNAVSLHWFPVSIPCVVNFTSFAMLLYGSIIPIRKQIHCNLSHPQKKILPKPHSPTSLNRYSLHTEPLPELQIHLFNSPYNTSTHTSKRNLKLST